MYLFGQSILVFPLNMACMDLLEILLEGASQNLRLGLKYFNKKDYNFNAYWSKLVFHQFFQTCLKTNEEMQFLVLLATILKRDHTLAYQY